jgi:hypothetical protein
MVVLLGYGLGLLLWTAAIYNFRQRQYVAMEFQERGIPTWLMWPVIVIEVFTGALLLFEVFQREGFIVATVLLTGSLITCLLTKWHRRLWLSVPMLAISISGLIWWFWPFG